MRNYKKTIKIFFHLLIWCVILSLNLTFFGGYFGHDVEMYKLFVIINAPTWGIYILLFYINYLIFIPKLLFYKNVKSYVFCSLAIIGLGYVGAQEIKDTTLTTKHQEELSNRNPLFAENRTKNQNTENKNTAKNSNNKNNSTNNNSDNNNNSNNNNRRKKFSYVVPENQSDSILSSNLRTNNTNIQTVVRKPRSPFPNEGDDAKLQFYGDVVYYFNETAGVRSVRQISNHGIYDFKDAHNITQLYLILLIFAISLILGVIERNNQRSRDLERIYSEKMTSELLFLKQQINPHFLFNALNSIYSLVLPHSDPASEAVLKLSSILRYMLYEADKKMVTLEKEIEIIRDYLDLQKFKINSKTKVNFVTEGNLRIHTIEPLLFLPFIENCYKYGADNVTDSFIDIKIISNEKDIILTTSNKVVVTKTSNKDSGIGIKNVQRRLDLLYEDNYKLEIDNSNNTFNVYLKLKLT